MGIFSRDSGTTFDAAQILGEAQAAIFDQVAKDGFMGQALSNVNPKKVKADTIALVGIIGDNSLSAYGDQRQNYAGSLQPALGAAHDQIVLTQLANAEEGVATLVTHSLVDGTLVYGLTPVENVELLGLFNGRKVRAGELADMTAPGSSPTEVMTYHHMTTRFPMTNHTKLRDRCAQQGVALVGESLKWKNLGRTVNAIGAFVADGLDMGSELDATGCSQIMGALNAVGFYNNYGALIGKIDDRLRGDLIRSIGYSGLVGRPSELKEAGLVAAAPETTGMDTEALIGWYMSKQGLANSVDEDLFLSRSTRPMDVAFAAGQLSQVVQQASVVVSPRD